MRSAMLATSCVCPWPRCEVEHDKRHRLVYRPLGGRTCLLNAVNRSPTGVGAASTRMVDGDAAGRPEENWPPRNRHVFNWLRGRYGSAGEARRLRWGAGVSGPAAGAREGLASRSAGRATQYRCRAKRWRGVLCLGESTAESGPRCGEAEEAKRRPALILGVGVGSSRAARRSARRPAPRPLFPLTLAPGLGYHPRLGVDVSISSADRSLRRG